mmetsp:Transcript_9548/g.25965  ORF Transcript_9548/g.25965 Transcript_9548/m.25965 type:complete len:259 (-) Transcript_9548:2223-2999(-)
MPGRRCLEPRGQHVHLFGVHLRRLWIAFPAQTQILAGAERKMHGVRRCERGKDPTLLRDVFDDEPGPKLRPGARISQRDRHARLARINRSLSDEHAPRRQSRDHRPEPRCRVGNRRRVPALHVHSRKPIQQRIKRDPHIVEPNLAVVDAIQSLLRPVVLDSHVRHQHPVIIPKADDKDVGPLPFSMNRQLSKHTADFCSLPCPPDPELARLVAWRAQHKPPAVCRCEHSRGLDPHHIRPVPELRHAKAPWKLQSVHLS